MILPGGASISGQQSIWPRRGTRHRPPPQTRPGARSIETGAVASGSVRCKDSSPRDSTVSFLFGEPLSRTPNLDNPYQNHFVFPEVHRLIDLRSAAVRNAMALPRPRAMAKTARGRSLRGAAARPSTAPGCPKPHMCRSNMFVGPLYLHQNRQTYTCIKTVKPGGTCNFHSHRYPCLHAQSRAPSAGFETPVACRHHTGGGTQLHGQFRQCAFRNEEPRVEKLDGFSLHTCCFPL